MRKNIFLSASLGNILEFYDFAIYGFFAATFGRLFFPEYDPINQLMASFLIFFLGFVARPLGAILFGYIGDTYGRNIALCGSILCMAFSTLCIGFLPTYEQAGILAPLGLSALRMFQGLSLGGEFSGSIVFVSEHVRKGGPRSPAFTVNLTIAAGVIGWFLASAVGLLYETIDFFSWRVPFIIGGIFGLFGFYFRSTLQDAHSLETPSKNIKEMARETLQYPLAILKTFSIGLLLGVLFYGSFIFPKSYIPLVTSLSSQVVSELSTLNLCFYTFLLPAFGWVADRIGYLKMMLISSALCVALSYPIFYLMTKGSAESFFAGQFLSTTLLSAYISAGYYYMSLQFPRHIRCLSVSISYNIGASLFGGLTPLVCLYLYKVTLSPTAPFLYFFVCSAVALTIILTMGFKSERRLAEMPEMA